MNSVFEQMKALGLNPRKEAMTLALFDILLLLSGIGVYLFTKELLVFLYLVLIVFLFDFVYLGRYGKALMAQKEKKEEDFVTLFTFFSIYISNGFNVYMALRESSNYCPASIKRELDTLLDGINSDKSVLPFLTFSSSFSSLTIKEVLLSVYQMIDEGGGDAHIARFSYLFRSFSAEKRKAKKEKESASLSSLSSLPLIGSGIAMLMLTAALSQIMGGLFNVI